MWHVYLLRCNDKSLYCGITKDLKRRVYEHNNTARSAKYTRARRPVSLVWAKDVQTRSDALRLEHRIKKLKKIQKEMIVTNADDSYDIFSSCL
jgi:putative endonuclease